MILNLGILLAAFGITTLEMAEASAVGLTLYADSKKTRAFLYVALGVLAVFVPMFLLGRAISLLPIAMVRLIGGGLLLYFGLRLVKSARRSVLNSRRHLQFVERFEKGLAATAFSVGSIEAFEAAIVLVALLPNSFDSTTLGIGIGVLVVVIATYVLKTHVRRLKQANMKVVVSALLLSFAAFWFSEVLTTPSDIWLILLFVLFGAIVYFNANRPSPEIVQKIT